MNRIDFTDHQATIGNRTSETKQVADELKQACQDFESYLLGFVFKRSIQPVLIQQSPFLSHHERWFRDMLVDAVAESSSEKGGIGLADYLYRSLERQVRTPEGSGEK